VSRRSGSAGIIGNNENWDTRMTLVPAQAGADCRDIRGEASEGQGAILAGGRRGVFCLPEGVFVL